MLARGIILRVLLLSAFVTQGAKESRRSHITIPQRVDKMGRALDPETILHHKRLHRNKIHYKLDLEGHTYHLDLHLNKNLYRDTVNTKSRRNGFNNMTNIRNKYLDNTCHYQGAVRGHSNSKVAMSNCHGLRGFVLLDDVLYLIEPMDHHSGELSDVNQPHIVYLKDEKTRTKSTCGSWPSTHKWDGIKRSKRKHKDNKHKSSDEGQLLFDKHTTQGYLRQLYLEVTLVLDKTLIDFHASTDLEAYILTIMNIVHATFADSTFGVPMELVLVRIIRLEQEDDELNMAINQDSEKVLEVFMAWQAKMNPHYDTHPDHHDMAILITRVDICQVDHPDNCGLLGLTRLGAVCDPLYSGMIVEDNGLALGFTIAHEIGHAMGMEHDNEEESGCEPLPYGNGYSVIMAEGCSVMMRGWSNCSREYLWAWLDTGQGHCLHDRPQSERYTLGATLPGEAYGQHYQCKFFFGKDTGQCADEGIECMNMKCDLPDYGCMHTSRALADGSQCGTHHWCYGGHCINQGSKPQAQDGGWSDWGPWTQCSRTCGGGVSRSVRHCDNPSPTNGGQYCIGQRIRFDICNVPICPQGQPKFRDVQCSEFDNMAMSPTNRTQTWFSVPTTAENPCELLCQNENKQRYVLRKQVEDGTVCYTGEHNMCVSGMCKYIPCDLVLDSKAVEDACGVCHGDGSSCSLQSNEVHFKPKASYQRLVVIAKDTKFAVIEEMSPTTSDFNVKVDKQEIINGRKYGVTMVGNMRLWLGQVKHEQEILKIRGPVTREIFVYVGCRDEVSVRYTLAVRGDEGAGRSYFSWKYVGWNPCSEPCGPGSQISEAKCVEEVNGVVEEKYCILSDRPPPLHQLCEIRICEPRWHLGEWSGCDCSCGDEEEERAVDCVRRTGSHEETFVQDVKCEPPKPISIRACICPVTDEKLNVARRRCARQRIVRKSHKNATRKLLCHTHSQNMRESERMHGSLVVDYENLDKLDFGLEVHDAALHGPIKDFPKAKGQDSLVHVKGKDAVHILQKVQEKSHHNCTKLVKSQTIQC